MLYTAESVGGPRRESPQKKSPTRHRLNTVWFQIKPLKSHDRPSAYSRALSLSAKLMEGASTVPCAQPRCCGGSWLPVRPAPSPARLRTAWRWPLRSRHCRCSRPRANHDHLGKMWKNKVTSVLSLIFKMKAFGSGDMWRRPSYHVVRSCCRRSHSCQSLRGCSSWLECTWPQPSWWRERMPSPDLLQTKTLINYHTEVGQEFESIILKSPLSKCNCIQLMTTCSI